MPNPITLRLGARGSMLSRLQSGMVAEQLQKLRPDATVTLTIIKTSGDVIQDRPLHEFGGKGLFTKELEQALLAGEVDFAVHSFKDVPVTMPLVAQEELVIAAVPEREDARDVLASMKGRSVMDLPRGAKVGTGSLRRQAQLLAHRPDLQVVPIRGNVDTRLRKLKEGEYDAVILALAGLKRSGLYDTNYMTPIPLEAMLPAAGQGALALQCRKSDATTRAILEGMNHAATASCVALEREIVKRLKGDCHSPIAALAELQGDNVRLRSTVAGREGKPPILRAEATAQLSHTEGAVEQIMGNLEAHGVVKLLHG